MDGAGSYPPIGFKGFAGWLTANTAQSWRELAHRFELSELPGYLASTR
jgi:hypothetical protein